MENSNAVPMKLAARRAVLGRCPCCGEGKLFRAYLKQVDNCSVCGETFGHIRADDAAPWLTIILVGHIFVPLMLVFVAFSTMPSLGVGGAVVAGVCRPVAGDPAARQGTVHRHPVADRRGRSETQDRLGLLFQQLLQALKVHRLRGRVCPSGCGGRGESASPRRICGGRNAAAPQRRFPAPGRNHVARTERTGPKRSTVLSRTNLSSCVSSSSVKPK